MTAALRGLVVALSLLLPFWQAAWAQTADGGSRVALVLGMSKYKAEAALPNAANDARLIGEALRGIGFDVDIAIDLGVAETRLRLRRFADKADGAAQAVFFFAGHGVQVNGVNYLMPVDSVLERERDLPDEAIDLERVLSALANASARIVILDACRNNPLARSMRPAVAGRGRVTPGLSSVQRVDAGTLIVFSTSPDAVALDGSGANSPFSDALGKHLGAPNLEIRQMLSRVRADVLAATSGAQLPWDNSSLVVDVYLNRASAPAATSQAAAAGEAEGARRSREESDRLFWASIKDSNRLEEFRIYLQQFPDGVFAALARQRLAALEQSTAPQAKASPPGPAPAGSPLSPTALKPDTRKIYDPEHVPFVNRPIPALLTNLKASTTRWALAIAPSGGFGVQTFGTIEDSSRAALEMCEFFNQQPCFLYAAQGFVLDAGSQGTFAPQPQATLRQTGGKLDPARVPFIDAAGKRQIEQVARASSAGAGHSALAINHGGKWNFRVDADLATAQREALAGCNKDSSRPCFLFAVDGKVVMQAGGPDRQTTAVGAPAASSPPSPTQAAPPTIPGISLSDQRYDPAQVPFVVKPPSRDLVDVVSRPLQWAVALTPSGFSFTQSGGGVSDVVRAALEGCEFVHEQACFLYAVSGWVVDRGGAAVWTPQPQDLLNQSGRRFDPAQIPFVFQSQRERIKAAVATATSSRSKHVLAISAAGTWGFRQAERADGLQQRALAACNEASTNKSFACFVFQVDGTVVMRRGGLNSQITR